MNITIKKKQTIETEETFELPEYFKHTVHWYKCNENGRLTQIYLGDIDGKGARIGDVYARIVDDCTNELRPITPAEFKKQFCKAVSLLAGFDICKPEGAESHNFAGAEDLESDVNGVRDNFHFTN